MSIIPVTCFKNLFDRASYLASDLVEKIVEETHRLKRMRLEFEEPVPDGSDTNASARFSAIQASLQHGSRERLL